MEEEQPFYRGKREVGGRGVRGKTKFPVEIEGAKEKGEVEKKEKN